MGLWRSQGNGSLFVQSTQPTTWTGGDLWVDTSLATYVIKMNIGGIAVGALSSATTIKVGGITDTLENFLLLR